MKEKIIKLIRKDEEKTDEVAFGVIKTWRGMRFSQIFMKIFNLTKEDLK